MFSKLTSRNTLLYNHTLQTAVFSISPTYSTSPVLFLQLHLLQNCLNILILHINFGICQSMLHCVKLFDVYTSLSLSAFYLISCYHFFCWRYKSNHNFTACLSLLCYWSQKYSTFLSLTWTSLLTKAYFTLETCQKGPPPYQLACHLIAI